MAVIAVVGGPGAPGATTSALALLLSWPLRPGRRVLLVECDPDGGAVLAGALEGRVEAVYGLRNLAIADRRGLLGEAIWEQLIDLSPDGGAERLLLPGLTDPVQAPGLAYTWEPLVEVLHGLEPQGYDVVLDLGRSGATGAGAVLARRADVVAVTVRTTLRGLSAARPRAAALAEDLAVAGTGADGLGLLLVTEGPYSAAEVSREFRLPVLGSLPYAPRTARVLSDGGDTTDRRFVRSELMRTARSAADEVQRLVARRRQRLAPAGAAALPAGAPATGPLGPQPVPPQAPQQVVPQPVAPQPVVPQPVPPQQVVVTGPVPPAGQAGVPGQAVPTGPVLATGPVAPAGPWGQGPAGPAPFAGLAPQPAAPAPFPAHVRSGAQPAEPSHPQDHSVPQPQQPYAPQAYAQPSHPQPSHLQQPYPQQPYPQPGYAEAGYPQPSYPAPQPGGPVGAGPGRPQDGPQDRPQDGPPPQGQGQGRPAYGEVLRAR